MDLAIFRCGKRGGSTSGDCTEQGRLWSLVPVAQSIAQTKSNQEVAWRTRRFKHTGCCLAAHSSPYKEAVLCRSAEKLQAEQKSGSVKKGHSLLPTGKGQAWSLPRMMGRQGG